MITITREYLNRSAQNKGLKENLAGEVQEMLVIFLYLALFFCTFTTFRLLVMKEMGESFFHYGFALVKALVLAKVVLLGRYLRLTRILDNRPLIVPTLYKVVLFSFFALGFEVLEHIVSGLLHRKNLLDALQEITNTGRTELLARTLVMLVAFVPFFAFGEIARVLGQGRLGELFFHKRSAPNPANEWQR